MYPTSDGDALMCVLVYGFAEYCEGHEVQLEARFVQAAFAAHSILLTYSRITLNLEVLY